MSADFRSMEKITQDDLKRLLEIARKDRESFFSRHPHWQKIYGRKILCTALCQGAALHYVDGKNGVKDFDVWTFYEGGSDKPFPFRRRGTDDFGTVKFGKSAINPTFVGVRVDMMGRSIDRKSNESPIEAVRRYLFEGKTTSARELAKEAVVILEPELNFGEVVWPINK